ncbi:amino acid/polyamine/organocation transporter, APC superfamily [Bacteroides luti]|uniref:Amino acid/polyamine/organocation transporter, APC superfamily n=1 Tax=Bacteroides luti TaxID=1297750 RepID=A0A1M5H075_9BACE|nr:amino acid permease [Bacteroides luti]SHG09327.1 amino acid/polyamine/organocation transporter, APC superfamily [Bacteroides luti]
MSLFVRKSISSLLSESNATDSNTLKKSLGPSRLVALGIGAIIGAGLFSITGGAAAYQAGPAITISFIVASLGCCFAGLCYAEFASMIPVAGSAYTYSYATMGEFIAWIIGWDLVLEYAIAAVTVSISWSRYLIKFLEGIGVNLPPELTLCPWDGGIINLPAAIIIILASLLLIKGIEGSARVNFVIVLLKIAVVLVFIVLGWKYIDISNYRPYIPANNGTFGEYGFSGIIRASAVVFFAFIGFDAVSTAAQEAKNPKRNMPIGILVSLLICTVLYFLFAHVMTGVVNYTAFKGFDGIAPVAIAIDHMGKPDALGIIHPDYPWLNKAIVLAILAGYSSVILVMLLGQSRIFYSMSKDGLLPKVFSQIHPVYRTPIKSNLILLFVGGTLAALVPARVAGEMTSIGTLLAFILVCFGILVMRKKMPDAPRAFKTPLVPLVPVLGIATCLFMMIFLPADTWIRLLVWMVIGFDVYVIYGFKNSRLQDKLPTRIDLLTLRSVGIIIALLLVSVVLWYQQTVGWNGSKTLMTIAFVIAFVHSLFVWNKLKGLDSLVNKKIVELACAEEKF